MFILFFGILGLLHFDLFANEFPMQSRIPQISIIGRHVCNRYTKTGATNRCEQTKECLQTGVPDLRRKIADTKDPAQKYRLLQDLGDLLVFDGSNLLDAASVYNEMIKLGDNEKKWMALVKKGLAHFLYGERQNCILNHNADSCLFPLSRQAQHLRQEGSEKAIKSFEEALNIRESFHLMWLYNLAHMTLGQYPNKVSKKWRLPESHVKKTSVFPRFTDMANAHGLQANPSYGGSLLVDDFSGDGLFEIISAGRISCNPTFHYVNSESNFSEVGIDTGLAKEIGVTGLIQADFDNDGDLDLYFSRGGWDRKGSFPVQNSLMRNDGKGKFENVTKELGLLVDNNNIASVWADFNNDGWIDLFVCNELRSPDLFINTKGKFKNEIKRSGIHYEGTCKGVVAGDINNDGKMDLFISIFRKQNQLYLGNGDNTFQKVSQPTVENSPFFSFPAFFFDYDNDGWLDLFVGSFFYDMENYSRAIFGKKHKKEYSRLFRNNMGTFEDVTEKMGLTDVTPVMGAGYGDLDGDGYPDILLGTGSLSVSDLTPNVVYKNVGGKSFSDISISSGMSNLQKGHGISVVDLDNNGKLDVVSVFGGSIPVDSSFLAFYKNPGISHHFLTLKLEGTKSNRSAIGARVKVIVSEKGKTREIHGTVGIPSSFGSSTLQLTLGLGMADKLVSMEVIWPDRNKTIEIFNDIKMNQAYSLKEGSGKLALMKLPQWKKSIESQKSQENHKHH